MSWTPFLTYALLDYDGTPITTFTPVARSASTRDELSAGGLGKARIDPGDSSLDTIAAQFCYGRHVQVAYLANPIFTWRIEAGGARPDDAFFLHEIQGRSWVGEWSTAYVRPVRGLGQKPVPDQRLFNFASPDYPHAGDAGWITPFDQGQQSAGGDRIMLDPSGEVAPAPLMWPDPDAWWIWGAADSTLPGKCFFRVTFDVPSGGQHLAFCVTGDNYYTAYLDGAPWAGDTEKLNCWMEHRRSETPLPEQTGYTLGFEVENTTAIVGTNPGALLFTMFTMAGEEVDTVIVRSSPTDHGWKAWAYPTEDPGWTYGDIVVALLAEAQARGSLTDWVLGFDAVNDSNGNPWPNIPTFACGVGDKLLKVLDDLAAQGWGEYHARPALNVDGKKVLDAWVADTALAPASGVFLYDKNASGAPDADVTLYAPEFGRADPVSDRVLVRYPGGYAEVAELPSGRQVWESTLTTDARNPAEAARNGLRALTAQGVAASSLQFKSRPLSGDIGDITCPYVGWAVGYTVYVPGPTGVMQLVRTLTITCLDNGPEPEWSAVWNKRRRDPNLEVAKLLLTLGSAVVGDAPGSVAKTASGLGSAVPSSTPIMEQRIEKAPAASAFPTGVGGGGGGDPAPPDDMTFHFPGLIEVAQNTDWWPVPYPGTGYRIKNVRVVMTTPDTVGVSIESPAGSEWDDVMSSTTDPQYFNAVNANFNDKLRARIYDIGGGSAIGVVVVVEYELTP